MLISRSDSPQDYTILNSLPIWPVSPLQTLLIRRASTLPFAYPTNASITPSISLKFSLCPPRSKLLWQNIYSLLIVKFFSPIWRKMHNLFIYLESAIGTILLYTLQQFFNALFKKKAALGLPFNELLSTHAFNYSNRVLVLSPNFFLLLRMSL